MILPFHVVHILDGLFYGQAEVKRAIAITIAASANGSGIAPRLLICGPSGTGKTSMISSLATTFFQPFVIVPITGYTQTGYVGEDVSDIINDLIDQAYETMELFEKQLEIIKRNNGKEEGRVEAFFYFRSVPTIPHALIAGFQKKLNANFNEAVTGADWSTMQVQDPERVKFIVECLQHTQDGFTPTKDWVDVIKEVLNKNLKGKVKVTKGMQVLDTVEDVDKLLVYVDLLGSVFVETLLASINANFTDYVEHAANRGVIVLDEIDKISDSGDKNNVGRIGVQRDLLSLLDPNNKTVRDKASDLKSIFAKLGNNKSGGKALGRVTKDIVVKHARVSFVGAGAFVEERLNGLIDELRGRFHFITKTHDFDKATMRQIVVGGLNEFNKTASSAGVLLVLSEDAVDEIAEQACKLNAVNSTGARRVTNILSTLVLLQAHKNSTGRVVEMTVTASDVKEAVAEIKRSTQWQDKSSIGFSR